MCAVCVRNRVSDYFCPIYYPYIKSHNVWQPCLACKTEDFYLNFTPRSHFCTFHATPCKGNIFCMAWIFLKGLATIAILFFILSLSVHTCIVTFIQYNNPFSFAEASLHFHQTSPGCRAEIWTRAWITAGQRTTNWAKLHPSFVCLIYSCTEAEI